MKKWRKAGRIEIFYSNLGWINTTSLDDYLIDAEYFAPGAKAMQEFLIRSFASKYGYVT